MNVYAMRGRLVGLDRRVQPDKLLDAVQGFLFDEDYMEHWEEQYVVMVVFE